MHIHGVRMIEHIANPDPRGSLTTVHRETEAGVIRQWNCVRSGANVLRGLHAHLTYDELYVPVQGRIFMVLKDARPASPTFGAEVGLWTREAEGKSIFVPIGVAHGFYFADGGILLCGLSQLWTGEGELTCRWNDAEVKTPWPTRDPILSEHDAAAGRFSDMAMTTRP